MGSAVPEQSMTAADYLAWDVAQRERTEFVRGEMRPMPATEDRHNTATGNLAIALRQHLRGTPCRTFMTQMKLNVRALDSYFYPDVIVTCSAADQQNPLIKSEPKLLVEVLSPSTAAYDRGDKFACYRQLPTLEEFVLVDLDTRATDVYRKGADGLWVLHPFAAGQTVRLASVELEISAAELFAEIDPPAPAQPPARSA